MAREDLIQIRRGSPSAAASSNPVLAAGEFGVAYQAGQPPVVKVGDGTTAWNDLAAIADAQIAAAVADMVPAGRTINGLPLSDDLELTATDIPGLTSVPGMVGLTIPTPGFSRFRTSTRAIRRISCYGDSVTMGGNNTVAGDGEDDYIRQARRVLRNRGFKVHLGFQAYWHRTRAAASPWSYSGTNPTIADEACRLGPFIGSSAGVQWMPKFTAATQIPVWTLPSGEDPLTGFDIVFVDHSSGSAEFSYSIDGGAWQAVACTQPATPTLKKHTVTAAVTTSIRVRGANASGAAATVAGFVGFDVRQGTTGIAVDNIGMSGATWRGAVGPTNGVARAGDWGALFDLLAPEILLVGFSNDIAPAADPLPEADLTAAMAAVQTRVHGYADTVAFQWPEQLSALNNRPPAKQHRVYELQADHFDAVLDINARWPKFGNNWATAWASGLWRNEGNETFPAYIHPIAGGDRDIGLAVASLAVI